MSNSNFPRPAPSPDAPPPTFNIGMDPKDASTRGSVFLQLIASVILLIFVYWYYLKRTQRHIDMQLEQEERSGRERLRSIRVNNAILSKTIVSKRRISGGKIVLSLSNDDDADDKKGDIATTSSSIPSYFKISSLFTARSRQNENTRTTDQDHCSHNPMSDLLERDPDDGPSSINDENIEHHDLEFQNLDTQSKLRSNAHDTNTQENPNHNKQEFEDFSCSICLQPFENGQSIVWSKQLKCGHIFHNSCLVPWLLKNNDCPNCRRELILDTEDEEHNDDVDGANQPDARSSSEYEDAEDDVEEGNRNVDGNRRDENNEENGNDEKSVQDSNDDQEVIIDHIEIVNGMVSFVKEREKKQTVCSSDNVNGGQEV